MVKLINYSLITTLPIGTSADPHIHTSVILYPWLPLTDHCAVNRCSHC